MKNYVRKTRAFTLIELVVAVALVGILSALVAPRVREQLAKGRDTKAISLLGSMRTAAELYYIEKGEAPLSDLSKGGDNQSIKDAIEKLSEYLDPSAASIFDDGKVPIGGSRKKAAAGGKASSEIIYGGTIGFTFINPDTSVTDRCDGVYMWFAPTDGKVYDSGGTLWENY